MRRMFSVISHLMTSFVTVFTIVACSMKTHPITINITNGASESTIFDKIFRAEAVTKTINSLFYTYKKTGKTAWVETNKEKVKQLNSELATQFYADFYTRSGDTYSYQFDINNSFVNDKLNFNGAEIKVIDGIKAEVTDDKTAPKEIAFDVFFQGIAQKYKFSGTVNWKYNIMKLNPKEETTDKLIFFWDYQSDLADIKINNFVKVT
ncbi:hypothetical protein [Spiroplasma endosymbiont of Calodromius spilotus]|uniref:hypothetical protein n=2 Tax=unclassified Spiroplasma TaxID=2637901 RepID=UPI0031FF350E